MKRGIALCFGVASAAIAWATVNAGLLVGDPAAGEKKSAVCVSCHGERGNALTPEWPKLAGQHASYLVKQLADFKSGLRNSPVMGPLAEPLSDQDMADLAAYFAAQTLVIGEARPELLPAGTRLYRGGEGERGVPACMACHGPAGRGNPAAVFPALTGQHAEYTKAQLYAYRSGERQNDRAKIMRDIAFRMTDEEIEAVSSYISGLH